jgi:hypothetical protein
MKLHKTYQKPINSGQLIAHRKYWLGKVEKNEKEIITLDSSYPGRDSDQVAPNMSRASLLHLPAEDWLRKVEIWYIWF